MANNDKGCGCGCGLVFIEGGKVKTFAGDHHPKCERLDLKKPDWLSPEVLEYINDLPVWNPPVRDDHSEIVKSLLDNAKRDDRSDLRKESY